jgi:hypothetical protein
VGRMLKGITPVIVIITCATLLPISPAEAQGVPVSLGEQLAAQYKVVKMGSDSGGYSVIEPGTLLTVQKGRNSGRALF